MKIKKMYQGTVPENKILDTYSTSATDTYNCNYINNIVQDVYSTDEIKTNKMWTNRKPIYRKVVDMGALPNTSVKYTLHNISNLETVINLTGMAFNSTTRNRVTLPYADSTSQYVVQLFANDTNVVLNTASNQSAFSESFAIIEYTKTTD